MILGGEAIRERIELGDIFHKDTCIDDSIKEASYALRVASDGLIVGGRRYRPGKEHLQGPIIVDPGAIAILSTVERMNMPSDLAGKLGIPLRLRYPRTDGPNGNSSGPLLRSGS